MEKGIKYWIYITIIWSILGFIGFNFFKTFPVAAAFITLFILLFYWLYRSYKKDEGKHHKEETKMQKAMKKL